MPWRSKLVLAYSGETVISSKLVRVGKCQPIAPIAAMTHRVLRLDFILELQADFKGKCRSLLSICSSRFR